MYIMLNHVNLLSLLAHSPQLINPIPHALSLATAQPA
jgi:hypothetical protein